MSIDALESLGIQKNSARIYLAALGIGTASVQDLAKKAGIKRSSVYAYIEDLKDKNLIQKVQQGKRTYYRAVSPTQLKKIAQNNLDSIESVIPELLLTQSRIEGRPTVSIFEDESGIRQIYEEFKDANSIRFFSSLTQIESIFGKDLITIATTIRENKIRTKEIIPGTDEAKRVSKKFSKIAGPTYSARISKNMFQNDFSIYNNVIVLFRIHRYNLYALRIEDDTLMNTMRTMFDMAWEGAKKFVR